MAGYSDPTAADALEQPTATSDTGAETETDTGAEDESEQTEDSGRDDTLFLPQDFPDAANLKKGDRLTFVVLGRGADGNVEVEHEQGSGKEPSWKNDLKKEMA